MDFLHLQSRVSGAYIPPHRTQLHPRMHSLSAFPSPNQKPLHISSSQSRERWCVIAASFLIIPFLFYLFVIGRGVHQSSKFGESRPIDFGIFIDASQTGFRIHVFESLNQGRIPFVQFDGKGSKSMEVRPGLGEVAPENAGDLILQLLDFAKRYVPQTEWKNTRVCLMVRESVGLSAVKVILDSSRRVIASSGFLFRDEWASLIAGEDEGVYAWVAANYVLGALGGDPGETTGIIELGGASVQVTFALKESSHIHSSRMVKLAGTTYNLYSHSLPQFGQDGAWESLHKLYHSTLLTSSLKSNEGILLNPCIPKGYDQTSGRKITLDASTKKQLTSHSVGNFSGCKSVILSLLQSRKDKCLHPPCRIVSSFLPELQGNPVSPDSFSYMSEFFGLAPRASLSELEAAGRHYCENDWTKLKDEHHGVDEMDLLRYCFSSIFIVALLHDNLGIPMDDKSVGFANKAGSMPLDWTLGAFILQKVAEPLESESEELGHVVGSDSLMYLSLFAFILLAFFAAFYVSKLWKPQLKTIYDLEKGHYIVTRIPR